MVAMEGRHKARILESSAAKIRRKRSQSVMKCKVGVYDCMVDGPISWSSVVRSVWMVVKHGPRPATRKSVDRKYRKCDEKA